MINSLLKIDFWQSNNNSSPSRTIAENYDTTMDREEMQQNIITERFKPWIICLLSLVMAAFVLFFLAFYKDNPTIIGTFLVIIIFLGAINFFFCIFFIVVYCERVLYDWRRRQELPLADQEELA